MSSLLLLSLLLVIAPAAAMTALAVWAARIEFRGIWRGHVVVIRNTTLSETLFIDGVPVTEGRGRLKLAETLAATIEEGGERVPVLAQIEPANLGMSIGAKLFIGGEMIPLERGPVGAFLAAPEPQPAVHRREERQNAERIPSDPRWRAMQALLVPTRAHATPEVAAICDQASDEIRALLLDIEDISAAEVSHRVLDGETGDGWQRAAALREQREMEVRELFRAVQMLHLQTIAGAKVVDASDLLAKLHGETELVALDRADIERRRRLAEALRSRQ